MGPGRLTTVLPELPLLLLELELEVEGVLVLLVEPEGAVLELEIWLEVVPRDTIPLVMGAGAAETIMGEAAAAKRTRVLKTLRMMI